jgi:protocatechuate 3,4-dioxygenase, beta subunit
MLRPTAPIEAYHGHLAGAAALPSPPFTRRGMLTASLAITGAGLAGFITLAYGQESGVRPTNEQILGPFYPVRLPADQDADLTIIAGTDARALGQVVYVSGRVINVRGEPVVGAELEIWQANAAGRYTHPSDQNVAPIDPNFEGYAKIRTGPDGSYAFKTVKPGAYPASPTSTRPPHIHFDVKGRINRLVTQMYFEGEALNDKDAILQRASRKEGLIARYGAPTGQQEPNALVAVWNIVLRAG